MTSEEAINRLEDTFEAWERWNPHNDSPSSKLSEALGMAIDALKEQEELERNLKVLESNHWISVEERPPEESGRYLVLEKCFGYIVARLASWTHYYDGWEEDFRGRSLWYDYDSEYGVFEVRDITHWMPLPEPPEVEV